MVDILSCTGECEKGSGKLKDCPSSCPETFHEAQGTEPSEGQRAAVGYKSGVKAVAAIIWTCKYCGFESYSCDSLLRPTETAEQIRTDNILCADCGKDNLVYIDL